MLWMHFFFEEQSDGLVPTAQQHIVEGVLDMKNFRTYKLESTHHDVIGSNRPLHEVLWNVNDTIEEQEDRKIYVKSS